jgi:hypothetical protein
VKDSKDRLFKAVEQGAGENALKVFILIKLTKQALA